MWCASAAAQSSRSATDLPSAAPSNVVSEAHAASEGTLTVTATVVSSVGLVTDPDGKQHVFLANAVDPADNVSCLQISSQHSAVSAQPNHLPQRARSVPKKPEKKPQVSQISVLSLR